MALVSDFASPTARAEAFQIVLDGGSLKAAAQALNLPLWLKKMPPEAFREPIRQFPSEVLFSAKITNFIPAKMKGVSEWLEQVSFADEACDTDFALWVAKHCGSVAEPRRAYLFLFLASWAWHCKRPDTLGYRLTGRPWSPKMGLRRATEELMRWRRRVDLACLIDDGIQSAWLETGHCAGYDFVALMTLDDFLDESQAMNNCLDQYADRLDTGLIRIFSIRKDGQRVGDIEVGPTLSKGGPPSIVQIKGPNNRQAPRAVWHAAQQWLESQALDTLPRRPGAVRHSFSPESFWRPYLDWLPPVRRADFERSVLAARRRAVRSHLPFPIVNTDDETSQSTHLLAAAR